MGNVNSIYEKYHFILSNIGIRLSASLLLRRMFYVGHFYFLTASLSKLSNSIRVRSDIDLKRASDSDWSLILNNLRNLDTVARKDVIARYLFYKSGFSGCYIGKNQKGEIVSIQSLIRPEDNPLIKKKLNRLIPLLKKNEVMADRIFIYPDCRGFGVFQTVNHKLLNMAKEEGFKVCHACIRKDNITSLNEFIKLGFRIKKLTTSYTLAGISWRNL